MIHNIQVDAEEHKNMCRHDWWWQFYTQSDQPQISPCIYGWRAWNLTNQDSAGGYRINALTQEPITYPISLSRRFHRPIYFQFEFISNSDPYRNLSDQLQSLARTSVDTSTWCRKVQVRPHWFILNEACSCRLKQPYFAGEISKNRLVFENTVALAYYGSCRL